MKNLKQLALNMVEQGTQSTHYGNWCFAIACDEYADDLEKEISKLDANEIEELVNELWRCEEVSCVDYDEDEISIYFYTSFCPQVDDDEEYEDDDEEGEQ
jgi:hypothetical protein